MAKQLKREYVEGNYIYGEYTEGSDCLIGYLDEDNAWHYYDVPIPIPGKGTANPFGNAESAPRKFRSDWNQKKYDNYKNRINNAKNNNGRSPNFSELLQQQNQKILRGAGVQMHQHTQRVLGGAGKLLTRLQPNNNPVKNTTNLMAFLSDTNPKSRTPKVLQTKVLQTNVLKSVINFQELIENQLELIKQLDIITTYQHGARYYIPWLARWTAVDAKESEYTPQSPYNYTNRNPIIYNDPSGNNPEDGTQDEEEKPKGGWGRKDNIWEHSELLTEDNYKEYGYNKFYENGVIFSSNDDGTFDGEYKYFINQDGTVTDMNGVKMTSTFNTPRGTTIKINDAENNPYLLNSLFNYPFGSYSFLSTNELINNPLGQYGTNSTQQNGSIDWMDVNSFLKMSSTSAVALSDLYVSKHALSQMPQWLTGPYSRSIAMKGAKDYTSFMSIQMRRLGWQHGGRIIQRVGVPIMIGTTVIKNAVYYDEIIKTNPPLDEVKDHYDTPWNPIFWVWMRIENQLKKLEPNQKKEE